MYNSEIVEQQSSAADMAVNKGFDVPSFGNDFYDMDSTDISYQDLFHSAQDQAVPDFMSLNTPAVHASTESYSQLNAFTPVSTLADTYLQPMDTPSYYSSASSNYSQSPAPISQLQNLPAAPEHVFGSRGPIIVPSATAPEPKPRRKGGRKPKNDPLPPHLEERRRLRRIRNKEAAQKCRERRLAQTDELLQQIDMLERQTRQFEEAINNMREFKDQCEFALNSHKHNCQQLSNRRRPITGMPMNNIYNTTSCSIDHRRSSSSEGDSINSPTFIM